MRRSLVVAGAALALTAASAHAQGSAVMTHSSCATAMGAAGVARPCEDGSAVLFNPAAIAQQPSVIGVGWTGIRNGGTFTYDISGEEIVRDKGTASVPFGVSRVVRNARSSAGATGADWAVVGYQGVFQIGVAPLETKSCNDDCARAMPKAS